MHLCTKKERDISWSLSFHFNDVLLLWLNNDTKQIKVELHRICSISLLFCCTVLNSCLSYCTISHKDNNRKYRTISTLERFREGGTIRDLIFNKHLSDISLSLLSELSSLLYTGGAHTWDKSLIFSLNWTANLITACHNKMWAGKFSWQHDCKVMNSQELLGRNIPIFDFVIWKIVGCICNTSNNDTNA